MAAGEPDPQVRRSIGIRFGLALGAATVLGAALGITGALLNHHRRAARHTVPHHATGAMLVVALCIVGAGVVLLVVGATLTIRNHRRGRGPRGVLNSPMLAMTFRERRGLLRQVNGKATADPSVLDITRNVAARIAHQQPSPAIFVGIALYFLGNALLSPSTGRDVLAGLYAIFGVLVVPLLRLPRRRAARFLSQNPLPAGDVA